MQAGPGGPALRTAAEELDAVMRDGKPGARGDPHAERFGVGLGQRPVHVHNPPAPHTREVMVGIHVGVEAGVGARDLGGQTLGDEEPEVAVHRAQAHAGQPAAHEAVDGLRGGVRVTAPQDLEDDAAGPGQAQAPGAEGRVGVF